MNKLCRAALSATAALALVAPSQSQVARTSRVNGAMLADLCRSDVEPSLLDPCNSYIIAATDAFQASGAICINAPDAYVPVAVGIVRKYLKDNPDKLNWQAALIVRTAIQQKFPCKGK